MRDWQSQSHVKWYCRYHVVFVPKYRRKTIYGRLRREIGGIIRELCRQAGVELVEGHAMADHVHLCLSIPPKYSFKGHTWPPPGAFTIPPALRVVVDCSRPTARAVGAGVAEKIARKLRKHLTRFFVRNLGFRAHPTHALRHGLRRFQNTAEARLRRFRSGPAALLQNPRTVLSGGKKRLQNRALQYRHGYGEPDRQPTWAARKPG